jgi:peptidoglycan DL-endopeptidase CwlO
VASHRRVRGFPSAPHRPRRFRRLSRLGGLAIATAAASGLAPGIGYAAPSGVGSTALDSGVQRTEAVQEQISQLYQDAEAATEAYDGAQERIARLQSAVAGEAAESDQVRAEFMAANTGLGRLAAEQYRDSGLDPTLALLLAAHPDTYLQQAIATARFVTTEQEHLLDARNAQQNLDMLQQRATEEFEELAAARSQLVAGRAEIESRLSAARADLAGLAPAVRQQVATTLDSGYGGGYGDYPGEGVSVALSTAPPSLGSLINGIVALGGDKSQPDQTDLVRSEKAVTAAYAELGKPYVWGATGPNDFDCSGLTQHVWAAAGVALPRTSEEQADIGGDVPLGDIRPGDLVLYFSGRTHIGIYVGQGLVIHAPHAGSVVQFAPLNSMPINKVVRPDE